MFDIYSYTNKGGRAYNEDFCGFWQEQGKGAFVLADGLGGHGHGEDASMLAVNYALNTARQNFDAGDRALLDLLDGANMSVIERQRADPTLLNMRTTIIMGFFSGEAFKYCGVGDSRAYYFKNGCIYAQSKDHSVPQMAVDLGEITAEEIRCHDDRSKLLKVLGDTEELNIKKVEPEIKIESGDAFLLCSDGFWEFVFEVEMEFDLIKSVSAKEWCDFMCKRLIRRVTGNNDNYTVLCGIWAD